MWLLGAGFSAREKEKESSIERMQGERPRKIKLDPGKKKSSMNVCF
jgi:hypothetical protein